jgi:hypothetical protein
VSQAGQAGPATKAFMAALEKHRNWDRALILCP